MNYVVATVRAKQKPNLVMKQRCQFLFLCLLCCTFTSMTPFTTSRSFFLFFWRMVSNAPFPLYNLSCMPLGSSTYHGHQSVQLSVTAVIIFSICPNTSPEQVPNGFISFALQQLERVHFSGESSVEHIQGVPSPLSPEQRGPVRLRESLTYSPAKPLDAACALAGWTYPATPHLPSCPHTSEVSRTSKRLEFAAQTSRPL